MLSYTCCHALRAVNADCDAKIQAQPRPKSGEEAKLSEQKTNQSAVVRWLQLFAAVGIPLVLVYLAVAGLVNPQFAELRDLISDNRDAIVSNREAIAANASSIARLEARIDLVAEVLILAITNENITEAEPRNLLRAGEE